MEELKPGVWIIHGENRGRFPFAHSLYLEGERRALIDTGAGKGLQQLVGKVDLVYLSHYHRDHVAGNSLFAGATFSIHPLDEPGVTSEEGFYRLTGLEGFGGQYWATLKQDGFTDTCIDEKHQEGDRIDLGGLTLRVVHTPGHTPGHCAFLVEEYDLLFTADIDLSPFGPWYGNDASHLVQFQKSVQRIRSLNPRMIVASHSRPVSEDIDARLKKYGSIIEERHKLVYSLLRRKEMSLEQLVDLKPFYRHHPDPVRVYRFFERNMLKKHLAVLMSRGLVDCVEGGKIYTAGQRDHFSKPELPIDSNS
ncbi:MAG: MBL fold metallo-hydrolase [Firmicutes bacterium]|nr:MBL fold metallo-hydrolase [Bacillota bacterium]